MYMLDTDICSYIIKKRDSKTQAIFDSLDDDEVCISVITEAELLYGLARLPERNKINRLISEFIKNIEVLDWDRDAANEYAKLRVTLEKNGKPNGNMDMMIAAHALSINATLVSNNLRHFAGVPKLKTENWV